MKGMTPGFGSGTTDQFWKSTKKRGGGAPAAPVPDWWFSGNRGRGFALSRGLGGVPVAPGPSGPPEDDNLPPAELVEKDCPASTIFEKRALGDVIEYLVEWRDDEKENTWEGRATLWKNWLMRPLINTFEEGVLAKAKGMITTWVKEKGELSNTMLVSKLKTEMPYFNPHNVPKALRETHGSLRQICENVEGLAIVGNPSRFTVVTIDNLEKKQKFESEKQKKLKGYFCELIEILRLLGGEADFDRMKNALYREMINNGYGMLNAQMLAQYGFTKLKEFVLACPGVYMDLNHEEAHTTGNVTVELRDPRPDCLKEEMDEKEEIWKSLGIDRNRELPEKAQIERQKARGPAMSMVERLRLIREGKKDQLPKPDSSKNDPLAAFLNRVQSQNQSSRGQSDRGGGGRDRDRDRGYGGRSDRDRRRRSPRRRSRSRDRRRKRSRSRSRKKKKRSRSRSRKKKRSKSSSSESARRKSPSKSPSSARSNSSSS